MLQRRYEERIDREKYAEELLIGITNSDENSTDAVIFYGQAGIGKSNLFKYLYKNITQYYSDITVINGEEILSDSVILNPIQTVLLKLRKSLLNKYDLSGFDITYLLYAALENTPEGIDFPFPLTEKIQASQIVEAVKKGLYQFPLLLEATLSLGKREWEPVSFGSKIFACLNWFFIQQTETIRQWWKLRGSQDLQELKDCTSLQDIQELLPLFLARDLQLHLQKTSQKAVVFIDNYEHLADTEGKYDWLKDLIQLNPSILWVIFAEKPIDLTSNIQNIPIQNLIDAESLDIEQKSGIDCPEISQLIIQAEYQQSNLQLSTLLKLLKYGLRSQQQQQVIDWFLEQIRIQQQAGKHQFTVFTLQILLKHKQNALAFNLLGKSLFALGDYQQALIALQTAKKLREAENFEKNLTIATLELQLAACYLKLKRTSDAENAAKNALCIFSTQLNENSVEIAEVLNIQIEIAVIKGYYSEALKLSQQALQIFESHQNIQSLQLAQTKFTTAWLNAINKNFDIAQKLFRQTLNNLPDETHPLAIYCRAMLGNIYQQMGYFTYEQAYEEYKIALETAEINLGLTHPQTLQLITAIINFSRIRGEYDTVDSFKERRHANIEISRFEETPAVANRLNKLGCLLYQQGQYASSENILQQALQINCKVLSEQHPQTAESFHNLGLIYKYQRIYDTAEVYFKQALQIRDQIFGEQHPITANSLNSLAALYCCMEKYQQAEPLLQQALEICQQNFGEMHPHTATTLNNLAQMYLCQGLSEKAEPIFQRALNICLSVLGEEHPYTKTVESNLRDGEMGRWGDGGMGRWGDGGMGGQGERKSFNFQHLTPNS